MKLKAFADKKNAVEEFEYAWGSKTWWEKEKMLVTSIFFSHNVFYPIKVKNHHLNNIYFVVCKCFQSGPVKNFVVW